MTSTVVKRARHTARRQAARQANDIVQAELERHLGKARPHHMHRFHLWLPISLLWILFPLAVLVSPLAILWRANPVRCVIAVGAVFAALRGIRVEVKSPDADVLIRFF